MLVFSCHADTCFYEHALKKTDDDIFEGQLDNFAGIYAVMKAYFSGRLCQDYLRIELTYGEEENFEGAHRVLKTLRRHDMVIVIDVTGTDTDKDFVIEKCHNEEHRDFLHSALEGMSFNIYEFCPDPIATQDEVDVYSKKILHSCLLAIPCFGGDYNEEIVRCRKKSIESVAEALCRIAELFPVFCKKQGIVDT